MSGMIKISFFEPLINQKFNIQLANNTTLVVQLIEVTPGKKFEKDTERDPFSVVFRGPREITIPQGIYKIDHETAGQIEIFLVPIGPDEKGMCFEAGYSLEPGDEIVIMFENFPRDANVHAMSHRYHATVRWCKPLADSQAFFYNVGVEYEQLDL